MSTNAKDLRKQIRNVTQELLPEILTKELQTAVYAELKNHIEFKLRQIDDNIRASLAAMEARQKDVQGLLLREMTAKQQFVSNANGADNE